MSFSVTICQVIRQIERSLLAPSLVPAVKTQFFLIYNLPPSPRRTCLTHKHWPQSDCLPQSLILQRIKSNSGGGCRGERWGVRVRRGVFPSQSSSPSWDEGFVFMLYREVMFSQRISKFLYFVCMHFILLKNPGLYINKYWTPPICKGWTTLLYRHCCRDVVRAQEVTHSEVDLTPQRCFLVARATGTVPGPLVRVFFCQPLLHFLRARESPLPLSPSLPLFPLLLLHLLHR